MPDVPNLTGDYEIDFPRIKEFMDEVSSNMEFENFDGQELEHTLAVAATPEAISHKLGRIPRRFIVLDNDKAATIRRTAWSKDDITLESSVNDTTIKVFIQ
jgi:hypothetical protein